MTAGKPGLSIERHQEIGLELARVRDQLTALACEIGNAYPKASEAGRIAQTMTRPIDRLRGALESRMFAEHQGDGEATTHVYYPSPETRRPGGHQPQLVARMPFHDHDLWCCSDHAEEADAR